MCYTLKDCMLDFTDDIERRTPVSLIFCNLVSFTIHRRLCSRPFYNVLTPPQESHQIDLGEKTSAARRGAVGKNSLAWVQPLDIVPDTMHDCE